MTNLTHEMINNSMPTPNGMRKRKALVFLYNTPTSIPSGPITCKKPFH